MIRQPPAPAGATTCTAGDLNLKSSRLKPRSQGWAGVNRLPDALLGEIGMARSSWWFCLECEGRCIRGTTVKTVAPAREFNRPRKNCVKLPPYIL